MTVDDLSSTVSHVCGAYTKGIMLACILTTLFLDIAARASITKQRANILRQKVTGMILHYYVIRHIRSTWTYVSTSLTKVGLVVDL